MLYQVRGSSSNNDEILLYLVLDGLQWIVWHFYLTLVINISISLSMVYQVSNSSSNSNTLDLLLHSLQWMIWHVNPLLLLAQFIFILFCSVNCPIHLAMGSKLLTRRRSKWVAVITFQYILLMNDTYPAARWKGLLDTPHPRHF